MSSWQKSEEKIGSHTAIRNKLTRELELHGKYGFIWQYDSNTCAAVITNARIARKNLPKKQWPVLADDETLIKFPVSDLPKWIRILKVTRSRDAQIRLATMFGKE